MKKMKTKRIFAFFCAFVVFATSAISGNVFQSVKAASNGGTGAGKQDSLVAHWDFEGEGDAVYQDKATGGTVKDNLKVITSADTSNACQAPTVKDGIVAFEGKGGGLRAADSSDLDLTGEMTFYIRVNLWGNTGYDLLNKSSNTGEQGYLVHAGSDVTVLQLAHGENEAKIWRGDVMAKGENVWRELAFVVSRDEASGNLMMQGYQSKDATIQKGDDFVAMGEAVNLGSGEQFVNNIPLTIGNTYELDQVADVWRYFDDIRIYNKAYTMEQLAGLLNGTYSDVPTTDPLVAHWDFEGEGDEIYQDKATGGTVKDNLAVITSADTSNACQVPTVKDGIVAFEGKGGGLRATDSADLDITGEMTIFLRVNLWGNTGYDLLNKSSNTGEPGYLIHAGSDATVLQLAHGENEAKIWRGDVIAKGENVWRELMFVVSEDKTSGNLMMQAYQSKDDTAKVAGDFIALGEPISLGSKEQCANDIPLTIGNTYELDQVADVWRYFDDIRIYNKALTREQMVDLLHEPTVEESLVAHWNFEGEGDEVYQDKATGGTVKDNLKVITSADTSNACQVPTVSNGVIAFEGKGGGLRATDSSDLDITGEMTIFLRVNLWGNTGYDLLNKSSNTGEQGYLVHAGSDATVLQLAHAENEAKIWRGDAIAKGENVWRELMFVVTEDKTSGNLMMQGYQSKDATAQEVDDFVALGEPVSLGSKEQCANDIPLTIGNTYELDQAADVWRYFDDIRIYNKALTAEQLLDSLSDTNDNNQGDNNDDQGGSGDNNQGDSGDDNQGQNPEKKPIEKLEGFTTISVGDFEDVRGNVLQGKIHMSTSSYTLKELKSFDKTLLSFKTTFGAGDYATRIEFAGKDATSAFMLSPSADGKSLTLNQSSWNEDKKMAEDPYIYFSADTAGVKTFLNEEVIIQVSIEYGDFDSDGSSDDMKLGFYFNGVAYPFGEDTHKIITNCNMDNFGKVLTFYTDGSPIAVYGLHDEGAGELDIPDMTGPLDEAVKKITLNHFGIEDGTYEHSPDNGFAVLGKTKSDLKKTAICGEMLLKEGGTYTICYGGNDGWKSLYINIGGDGELAALWINEQKDSTFFGRTIIPMGEWVNFMFSTEVMDVDGDGEEDDIKLGIWFNGQLMNDKYYPVTDCASELTDFFGIHCTEGASVSLRSLPELIEPFDYTVYGLTADWKKTLLNTGLTAEIPVGGSKESGPFAGDLANIATPILLIGISLAGFILYGNVRRKQNEK